MVSGYPLNRLRLSPLGAGLSRACAVGWLHATDKQTTHPLLTDGLTLWTADFWTVDGLLGRLGRLTAGTAGLLSGW
jgi:hypothetical protein